MGAGVVEAFLKRGDNVVANSRNITKVNLFPASANIALVDGDIGNSNTAAKITDTDLSRLGGIKDDPKDYLKTLQPMGRISDVKDIVEAILYLAEAGQMTREVLHVDAGAHVGRR